MLRRVFHDDAKEPTYLANVQRRGYRLIAPVARWVDVSDTPKAESSANTPIVNALTPSAIGSPFPVHQTSPPLLAVVESTKILDKIRSRKCWRSSTMSEK